MIQENMYQKIDKLLTFRKDHIYATQKREISQLFCQDCQTQSSLNTVTGTQTYLSPWDWTQWNLIKVTRLMLSICQITLQPVPPNSEKLFEDATRVAFLVGRPSAILPSFAVS